MAEVDADGGIGVRSSLVGQVAVVAVSGVIDVVTAPVFVQRCAQALSAGPAAVVVDLTEVDFLSSAGLDALLDLNEAARGDTVVAVVADGPATARPIIVTGIDAAVPVFASLDQALVAVSG